LKSSSSLLMEPLEFLRNQCASSACSFLWILVKLMNPCFILSYNPVDKIRFILVARQKISWNVKPGPFLVVSQLSGDSPSGNLWHAIAISQNCLNWTKAYTHFLCNAQVSPPVAHDQIVHSFGRFIVGGLFWPPMPLTIISNALPAPLEVNSPFFIVLYDWDFFPSTSMKYSWISLGTSLSYRGT
jgi:hypothetical protein